MTVIHVKKRENPFVQIDKSIFNNEKISWKAKGILGYLLSKPSDWKTYVADLEKRSTDGRDSTRNGLQELIKSGYIERKEVREKGRFKGYDYIIHEIPIGFTENGKTEIGKTEIGKTENGKTEIGKPVTTNNELTNNESTNNDFNNNICAKRTLYDSQFKEFWSLYPKKTNKKTAYNSFKRVLKEATFEDVMKGLENYIEHIKRNKVTSQYILHASTFLNGKRFEDEYETEIPTTNNKKSLFTPSAETLRKQESIEVDLEKLAKLEEELPF